MFEVFLTISKNNKFKSVGKFKEPSNDNIKQIKTGDDYLNNKKIKINLLASYFIHVLEENACTSIKTEIFSFFCTIFSSLIFICIITAVIGKICNEDYIYYKYIQVSLFNRVISLRIYSSHCQNP